MMDDLISRRDAINAVSEITTTMSVCTNKDECYGMKRMQKQALTELENLPSAEPNTTTHDSIPAETGKNDGDKTSGDCISRQAVTKFLNDWLSCLFENCHKQSASDLKMIIKDFKNLPSAQPETNCSEIPNNSDTISRQQAIDALCSVCNALGGGHNCDKTKFVYNAPFDEQVILCPEHYALTMLPSIQPEQRWIPVSERLPEEKGEYLVTYHPCYWDDVEDEIKVGIDSFRGKTAWAKKKYQRVIAWMPLPEPYQEGEQK